MHDYVMLWNALALELNRRDHTGKMNAKNQKGPTRSSRALAMVHIAMHDAYFGRTGLAVVSTLQSLQPPISTFLNVNSLNPPIASPDNEGAAISAAAATVLRDLYPDFTQLIDDTWRGFDFGAANAGRIFGEKVGKEVIDDRKNDGSDSSGGVPEIAGYWRHREDPTDLGQGLLGARWGTVRLFSAGAIPPMADHPTPRSTTYNNAHDEVRIQGNELIATDDPKQTPYRRLVGLYWAYDGASQIGTPPRLYNQIVREIIGRNVNGGDRQAASARLLALINVAMADAGIASWYYKYVYQLWRPILGVREYDNSFWYKRDIVSHALHSKCDPWWVPYGAPRTNEPGRRSFTPPFPAYPSGHATFGAAAFEMTRRFFGVAADAPDTLFFDFVSDELDGRAIDADGSFRGRHRRHHESLLQAIYDNSVSRVFLGVHWRFDGISENVQAPEDILSDTSNIGGVPLGRSIAQGIFDNKMQRNTNPGKSSIVPKNLLPDQL